MEADEKTQVKSEKKKNCMKTLKGFYLYSIGVVPYRIVRDSNNKHFLAGL